MRRPWLELTFRSVELAWPDIRDLTKSFPTGKVVVSQKPDSEEPVVVAIYRNGGAK